MTTINCTLQNSTKNRTNKFFIFEMNFWNNESIYKDKSQLITLFVMVAMMIMPSAFAENEGTIVLDEGSLSPNDDCTEVEFGFYIP